MPLYKPSKSKDLYHMAGRLGPRVVCRSIVVQLGKKLEGDNQGSILVSGNKHNFFWTSYFCPLFLFSFFDCLR